MKLIRSLILLGTALLSVNAAVVKRLTDNDEPKDEICILSIVPCPDECPTTCIYPDKPCPKQYPPHCPADDDKKHHHHHKPPTKMKRELETEVCDERPCPRVRFQPCPEECPNSCHFVNPADPCCPFSGKPVCKMD